MFKMMIEIDRPSATSHAIGYVEGIQDGENYRDQAETWAFGLVWGELNRLQVGHGAMRDVFRAWRSTGRVAYSNGRGRPRWIATVVRGGATGVTSFAYGRDIAEGDVIVVPFAPDGEPATDLVMLVDHGGDPYPRGGHTIITIPGRNMADGVLATVDVSPDTVVEVTTYAEAQNVLGVRETTA